MCGIVGFVTPRPGVETTKRNNFLFQGLLVDQLRGTGGTGVALVDREREISVYKRGLQGSDFINSEQADRASTALHSSLIAIGHNRAATIGSVKDKNAHPFHFKDKREIVLVHNGTLNNHYQISPTGFRHDVDSAHAAMALAASDDVGKTLRGIKGWFVFVWYDVKENTFNIARNNNRDIYYIRGKDDSMYFGSEYKMLDWLIDRNGIELAKDAKYGFPGEHEWYIWTMQDGILARKPKMVKIEPEKERFQYPARELPAPGQSFRRDNSTIVKEDVEKMGFDVDQGEWFMIDKWESYSGADENKPKEHKYGKVSGSIWNEKGDEVKAVINGVRLSQFEFFMYHFDKSGLPVFPIRVVDEWMGGIKKSYIVVDVDLPEVQDMVRKAKKEKGNVKGGDLKPQDTAETAKIVKEILKEAGKELELLPSDPKVSEKMLKGPGVLYLPEKSWKDYVAHGCGNCTEVPEPKDADTIEWIPGTTPAAFLCSKCADDGAARENAGVVAKGKVH